MDSVPVLEEGASKSERDSSQREGKKIILIRHSESINNVDKREAYEAWSNVATLKSLPTWSQLRSAASLLAVPMNTDLSEDGLRMVSNLRRVMDESNFVRTHMVELVVHSHLTRAARTCEVLFEGTGIPIIEHQAIFEKNISEHLKVADMKLRIAAFTEWLLGRPESSIVVVGHSAFFRDLLNTELKLKNCEVRSCVLNGNGAFEEGATVTIVAGGAELLQSEQSEIPAAEESPKGVEESEESK